MGRPDEPGPGWRYRKPVPPRHTSQRGAYTGTNDKLKTGLKGGGRRDSEGKTAAEVSGIDMPTITNLLKTQAVKSTLGYDAPSIKCLPMSSPTKKCAAGENIGQQESEGPPQNRVAGQSPRAADKAPGTVLSQGSRTEEQPGE